MEGQQGESNDPIDDLDNPETVEQYTRPDSTENQAESSIPAPNSTETQTLNQSGGVDISKLRSDVWQHMTKVEINKEFKAVCKYCGKILAAGQNSGTRHMRSHIEKCLNAKKQLFPEAYQQFSAGKNTISNTPFSQETSRRDLVTMIIVHEYPLSMVQHEAFRTFLNNLQPLFKIPCRSTVRSDVMKLYMDKMKKTMNLLDNNKGRVAITTDMWTADNQKKSYMAVTVHFVDNSWCLQQRLLRYIAFTLSTN